MKSIFAKYVITFTVLLLVSFLLLLFRKGCGLLRLRDIPVEDVDVEDAQQIGQKADAQIECPEVDG